MTQSRNAFLLSIGVLAVITAFGLYGYEHRYLSSDDGWLLHAVKRMMGGDRPYIDFMETNPPLILWIYMIPVGLAHYLRLHYLALFPWFVCSCIWLSLWLSYLALREREHLIPPALRTIVLGITALMLLWSPTLVFGQREHLWMIFILPYLFANLGGASRKMNPGHAVLAGIGFCIKPYFLLVWIVNELVLLVYSRQIRTLFRPTNWIIGGTCLIYLLLIFWITPAYVDFMVPALQATYGIYTHNIGGILGALGALAAFYCIPILFPHPNPTWRHIIWQLLALFAASVCTVLIQQKGWGNHYFPPYLIGSLVCTFALAGYSTPKQEALSRKHFACLCVTIAFFMPPTVAYFKLAFEKPTQNVMVERLVAAMTEHAVDKPVMALSFNLEPSFPAASMVNVRYMAHFHQLWIFPPPEAIRRAEGAQQRQMEKNEAFLRKAVCEDLKKHLPALVWVDNNSTSVDELQNFDFIGYFKQDPCFTEEWRHYRKLETVVDVFTRYGVDSRDGAVQQYTIYVRR